MALSVRLCLIRGRPDAPTPVSEKTAAQTIRPLCPDPPLVNIPSFSENPDPFTLSSAHKRPASRALSSDAPPPRRRKACERALARLPFLSAAVRSNSNCQCLEARQRLIAVRG